MSALLSARTLFLQVSFVGISSSFVDFVLAMPKILISAGPLSVDAAVLAIAESTNAKPFSSMLILCRSCCKFSQSDSPMFFFFMTFKDLPSPIFRALHQLEWSMYMETCPLRLCLTSERHPELSKDTISASVHLD